MMRVEPSELNLGDLVAVGDPLLPCSTCAVTQIKDGQVHLFRPYVTTADFTYTGGVIPYIGVETMTISLDSKTEVWLIRKADPKR